MECIGTAERATGECRISTQGKGLPRSIELLLWCTPLEVSGHLFSILAAVDISDKKRRLALERMFFHDLLNGLQASMGYVELMSHSSPSKWPERFPSLYRSLTRLAQEITSHHALLKAENEELSLKPATINSSDFLQEILELYFTLPSGKTQNVILAADTARAEFFSDPVLLGRVLRNMITNALEALQPDEHATVGSRLMKDHIEFWVHNPNSMPYDVQLQVFQRSFSTKGPGRGLGTYSMRLLSERYMEGSVKFVSNPDTGTVFAACYPLKPCFATHSRMNQG